MGDIIHRKILLCIAAVISTLVLTAAFLCTRGIYDELKKPDFNTVHTEVNQLLTKIENSGEFEHPVSYPYAVILPDGTVIYQNQLTLNHHVNLHSLGTGATEYYMVPIQSEDTITGILYVELYPYFCGNHPQSIALWVTLFVVILILAVGILLILFHTLQRDIFTPIRQLHDSTNDILYGKLNQPVRYDYDGEVGTLCHDFELMRKELADGLRREQTLKDDEKLLMASISHDLKTPLATVQGYLESICIGVITDEEEIKRYCQNALNKTVMLGNLTNDILEHSKAELRQLSIEKEELYTTEFFDTLTSELAADAASRGFTLQTGEIPNILISLDRLRITQVFENIVGNSFKYGHEKGRILIEFSLQQQFLIVTIEDDGQGIPSEDLPFVFQKFFRTDKARTQSIPGSGLGLSIAKYIVEQHGGSIECDSILGTGTIVRFSLSID